MKKSFMIITSLYLLLLTGCGQSEATYTTNDGKEKLSIMLDWYPNAVHSFLYTAKEKGYFAEQGLDVDIQMPADTNDPLRLAAAGKIDLALSYQPEVLVARSEDIPVQSIAAIVRHPLNQVMVPADSPIQTPKDLAGKTIGYPSIPLDEAIIGTMIQSDGGNPKNAKMIDIGWDLIPALTTNKTDAIIGGYINHEKLLLEKQGHPIRTLNPAEYGVPDYYELVLVASEKGLKEKPEDYQKFMKAITKGQKYVTEHPEEGLAILFDHEEKSSPLEKDTETKSLEILLPLMDAKDKPFGWQNPVSWDNVANWLIDKNVISEDVQAEDAFVNIN